MFRTSHFKFSSAAAVASVSLSSEKILAKSSLRSKAGLKLVEIDRRVGMFQKLQKFEQLKIEYDKNNKEDSNFINMYSAVDFGASPGGFAQILSRNLTRKLNNRIDIPHAVVTIDTREITPQIHNCFHLRGGIEEHGTLKRIQTVMGNCNAKYFSLSTTKKSGENDDDIFLSPAGMEIMSKQNENSSSSSFSSVKHRIVIVTNDTVAIVKGNSIVKKGDDFSSPQRKYSVTYAQNNLVCCAMRRSFALLDCFQKQQQQQQQISRNHNKSKRKGLGSAVRVEGEDEAEKEEESERKSNKNIDSRIPLDSYCPPCFFISKILRSVHVNRVVEMASKYFDHVQLLELNTSSSEVERYLIAETKPSKFARKRQIMYRDLSLPPAAGEAAEWFCWGCLHRREGNCLKCPLCSK
jgi:23S rRNA U2552 (ribose-2'-O)-methylase RlmE/FtsJ